MKKLIFALLCVLSLHSCDIEVQEEENPWLPDSMPESKIVKTFKGQNSGSAAKLRGKVHVVTVFISETKWDTVSKKEVFKLVEESQEWLKKEAKRYKSPLSFSNSFLGFDKTIFFDYIESGEGKGNERVDWVSRVLQKVNYTPLDFYHSVKKEFEADEVLICIIANKPGRSYSIPFSEGSNMSMYFLEGCIMYTHYRNGEKHYASGFAHEFLHLFGAWDLYETFMTTKENEEIARKIFPNDIMLRVSYQIDALNIGALTAYLTGLSDKYSLEFDKFEPIRK